MANPRGRNAVISEKEMHAAADAFRAAGGVIMHGARALGIDRSTFRRHIERAKSAGIIDAELADAPRSWAHETVIDARTRKVAAFTNAKKAGDWRKPVLVNMPARPFRLKLFGDPHLDANGCDFELFDRHFRELDGETVHGICVGDWFNNWKASLAHLWRGDGDPSDAWVLFEDLMEAHGHGLIAACSGNHDDWSRAPADPIDLVMKRHGVIYRVGAVRIMLNFPGLPPMGVSIRHKWRGASMYSSAHAINRAAMFGWRDHLMVGGHIHQDEPRMRVSPDGFVSHMAQLSAFKVYDVHADTEGYMPHRIQPVWDAVIDPRRADADPDKIKFFWSSEAAAAYLTAIL
jgi:hypothetical protein